MQRLLQSAKKLLSMCLVTLLLITGTILISPAPARANGERITNVDCRYSTNPNCGNTNNGGGAALAAGAAVLGGAIGGVIGGSSFDALSAAVITSGATAVGHAIAASAAPVAAAISQTVAATAAPVVVPVAVAGAVAGGAYFLWQSHNNEAGEVPPSMEPFIIH